MSTASAAILADIACYNLFNKNMLMTFLLCLLRNFFQSKIMNWYAKFKRGCRGTDEAVHNERQNGVVKPKNKLWKKYTEIFENSKITVT